MDYDDIIKGDIVMAKIKIYDLPEKDMKVTKDEMKKNEVI